MTKPKTLQEALAGLPKEQAELAEELGEEFMLKHWRMMKASRDFLESLWCGEVASSPQEGTPEPPGPTGRHPAGDVARQQAGDFSPKLIDHRCRSGVI